MRGAVVRWYWPSTLYAFLLVLMGGAIATGQYALAVLAFVASVVLDTACDCLRSRK